MVRGCDRADESHRNSVQILVSSKPAFRRHPARATRTKRPDSNTKNVLAKMPSVGKIAFYRANHTVFVEGDPGESVFCIETGKVRVSVLSNRGKEAVLAILGPGDFVGG